ncbi:carboxylate-amine ligase [Jatrophihabitans endophyticus]|uniref:Putative glutamate--cysteine ligase 2 n=1 Tax=Jatrophihabitans endophyticus TaxID=1206085 RepID=A0A1M5E352_9ACTN|nr:YbdK family carboxylate-amine ligase [Jatrophihabitans endophyticus]SHF73688.1 carboxylate-amine ligase [Jatrophihabitans endophyticus]
MPVTPGGDAAAPLGATLGIEEEYHLVDPTTFTLQNRPELSTRALDGRAGPHLRPEMLTSQLEAASDVCTTLAEARAAVVAMRQEATRAAASTGATILATSTHPSATLAEIELMARERYDRLTDRFGPVVRAVNLCGCHVHVAVPDLELAVRIMAHARPSLPLLGALTGSSPFHEGADTGYESFRVAWLSLWQQGGPPPQLDSAEDYLATVDQLLDVGLVDEPSQLLWDLRPSSRYPTLEFRMADVCPVVDDVVLFAAVVRSLVRTLGARIAGGVPALRVSDPVLRGWRWRAARHGLRDRLWSPARCGLVPARVAVDDLLAELRDDLAAHDELATVTDLGAGLLDRGTSARRQRACHDRSGDLGEVVRDAVAVTAGR